MEGDDDFMALINKYEILHNKDSLDADSKRVLSFSFLDTPVLTTHESSKVSPLTTVSKEISMIHDLRSTSKLQKEINELETKKQEKLIRKSREKLYNSLQREKESIKNLLNVLQCLEKKRVQIETILNSEGGGNSLPIPRHLHEKTINSFKTMADICNNYESIANTFAKKVNFEEAFENLSEAVHEKKFNTLKGEMDAAVRYLALLETRSVSGADESSRST